MKKNLNEKTVDEAFTTKESPLFAPYLFHLYFQRRVDDLIRLELQSMFHKVFWGQPFGAG